MVYGWVIPNQTNKMELSRPYSECQELCLARLTAKSRVEGFDTALSTVSIHKRSMLYTSMSIPHLYHATHNSFYAFLQEFNIQLRFIYLTHQLAHLIDWVTFTWTLFLE